MRNFVKLLGIIGLLAACQPNDDLNQTLKSTSESDRSQVTQTSETERLNEWFSARFEEQLQMSPLALTILGRKDRHDQFNEFTEAEEKRQLAWRAATVTELQSQFDYDKLEPEARTSYDLWVYQYEQAAAAQEFMRSDYIFVQMQGAQALLAQFMINYHKVDNESDMVAYNKRIAGVAKGISDLLARAKIHANEGVRPPRFAYEGVVEQATNLVRGAPFTDDNEAAPLWADAQRKISALAEEGKIDEATADALREGTRQALLSHFKPSYAALISWFKADIENTDDIARGVGHLPNGKAFYEYSLKARTTTDLTADQIHDIGLREVERITGEMLAIKSKVGFEGDLQAFFSYLVTNGQFYYPDTDEGRQGYITDTESYYVFIKQQLGNYFGILPKADLVVKRVESFREQDGAAAHYFPGTPDGSRPGVYYAHLSDMKAMPRYEMEAVAVHEGLPGHHMQISIAQELTTIPLFRTQAGFAAYSEGWGLYAELLAKEMGAYQDSYSDLGRLSGEMWRAVRLVVDTGIHAKGWSEEQAITYFKKKTPIADATARSEVRRYMVWPGQATAYKIGMLKILELRQFAENALGDKFDIRLFHDTILGGGALPLPILEHRVKDWVTSVETGR